MPLFLQLNSISSATDSVSVWIWVEVLERERTSFCEQLETPDIWEHSDLLWPARLLVINDLHSKETTRDPGHILCVCEDWQESCSTVWEVLVSETVIPCSPAVAPQLRAGHRVHVCPCIAGQYAVWECVTYWPLTLFSPFVFIRPTSCLCCYPAETLSWFWPSLLRISRLLLWTPMAGGTGFDDVMDAPFIKLVAACQCVLCWMDFRLSLLQILRSLWVLIKAGIRCGHFTSTQQSF